MDRAVSALNKLSLRLLLAHRGSLQDGNIFFSPFSIAAAFAMLSSGAKASTKEEMENILAVDSLRQEISALFKSFHEIQDNILLKTVNILAVDQHYEILSEFSNNLKENYDAECQSLDFVSDAERARKQLNDLIELATHKMISGFFTPSTVTSDTKLILANATYFKGTWEKKFSKQRTTKKPFYNSKNQTVMVDMMYKEEYYKYFNSEDLDATFLEMPYLGNKLSMIVVLPNKNEGLPFIEKNITVEKLKYAVKSMSFKDEVYLSFPKFKLEEFLPLKGCLMDIGMKEAFTMNADLSGVSGKKELFVSSALHKAFIEVNEEGTVATAATEFEFQLCCLKPFCHFTVDHPFMFFIQATDSGLILFAGSIHTL